VPPWAAWQVSTWYSDPGRPKHPRGAPLRDRRCPSQVVSWARTQPLQAHVDGVIGLACVFVAGLAEVGAAGEEQEAAVVEMCGSWHMSQSLPGSRSMGCWTASASKT
jgi:hypothetical protein